MPSPTTEGAGSTFPSGSAAVSAAVENASPRGPDAALLLQAAGIFSAGLAVLLALGTSIADSAKFDWMFVPAAVLVYAVIVTAALAGLRHHPYRRFGAPNVVTTVRAVATALFAGLILEIWRIGEGLREPWVWVFAGIALGALLLDGVDGYLARKLSLSSRFGARYDMEVDALLILLLSALAYGLGKAGAFVLAIGLMRYAFVGAQQVFGWLSAELPPSFRRKAICVLQAAMLGVIITPVAQPPLSGILAAVTVAALAWSFAVDILWLHRHRRKAAP